MRSIESILADFPSVRKVEWSHVVKNRDQWWTLVNSVMNLRVPGHARNFLTSGEPISCSIRTVFHGGTKR
jgi:hypothetical protein